MCILLLVVCQSLGYWLTIALEDKPLQLLNMKCCLENSTAEMMFALVSFSAYCNLDFFIMLIFTRADFPFLYNLVLLPSSCLLTVATLLNLNFFEKFRQSVELGLGWLIRQSAKLNTVWGHIFSRIQISRISGIQVLSVKIKDAKKPRSWALPGAETFSRKRDA